MMGIFIIPYLLGWMTVPDIDEIKESDRTRGPRPGGRARETAGAIREKPKGVGVGTKNFVDGSETRRWPVDVVDVSVFIGFFTSQVVVWDFWTINSFTMGSWKWKMTRSV